MGKISDLINQMFQRSLESAEFTSASPGHINNLIQVNAIESPDFEAEFKRIVEDQTKTVTQTSSEKDVVSSEKIKKTVEETKLKIDGALSGNLGDLKNLSTEQFGNITSLATNPFGFVTKTILAKLTKGAGVIFILAIAVEVAKFLIEEMFKPGRMFDMRFRQQIDKQIVQFLTRKEQEELRSGYKSLITTTIGGLRGNSLRGQVGGNFYSSPTTPGMGVYDPSYVRFPSRAASDMRTAHSGAGGSNNPRSNRGNNR